VFKDHANKPVKTLIALTLLVATVGVAITHATDTDKATTPAEPVSLAKNPKPQASPKTALKVFIDPASGQFLNAEEIKDKLQTRDRPLEELQFRSNSRQFNSPGAESLSPKSLNTESLSPDVNNSTQVFEAETGAKYINLPQHLNAPLKGFKASPDAIPTYSHDHK